VPASADLKPETFARRSELPGIDLREAAQLELLARCEQDFRAEYEQMPRRPNPEAVGDFFLENQAFGSVDAEILHCLIRRFKPKQVVEVGAGFSTLVTVNAARANAREDAPARITTIEPYPSAAIRDLEGAELIEARLEEVPLARFDSLEANDVLFLDSSHVLRTGGDVQRAFGEVLPRLQEGVLVHVHDIFLPAEYPRAWLVGQKRFWNEQYLLQAFLAFNEAFEVIWGSSYMHLNHPDRLASAFPSYEETSAWPGSFWVRRATAPHDNPPS
jgi:predicted O-methyltransferase YrrM